MNNDLISRSALFKKIQPVDFLFGNDEDAPYSGMAVDACDVDAAPAVDAVEVVRCKKCQHYKKQYKKEDKKCCTINAEYDPDVGVWYGLTAYPPPDFYCADGERRKNGT